MHALGWQLASEDEEEDVPFATETMSDSGEFMSVQKEQLKDGKTVRYTRRLKAGMPGADAVYSVHFVDVKTRLPVAEETFVQGERIMRAEYFDVGASIEIELPGCLKQAGGGSAPHHLNEPGRD